jgi:cytochrome c-type biogenesis protein CcmE
MNKKQRLVLGISIVVVLLGFLVFNGGESKRYEVSEAVAAKANLVDKIIDVNGTLIPNSNQWDTLNRTLTFKMTDGLATIDVMYQGENIDVPPGYQNIQVIATGQFNNSLFVAIRKPLTKCPSKYESSAGAIARNKT